MDPGSYHKNSHQKDIRCLVSTRWVPSDVVLPQGALKRELQEMDLEAHLFCCMYMFTYTHT